MKARIPDDNPIQAERLKMIEELMKHPLEADDSFSFRCDQCGECCKNRNDIILSVFDICRIAKHKNMELKDVIEKYGYLYIGDTSRIPLVALKMRTDNGECPFFGNMAIPFPHQNSLRNLKSHHNAIKHKIFSYCPDFGTYSVV